MKLQGRVQVFKVAEGQKSKDYVTLQDFQTGSQFQVGVDKAAARDLRPGDFINIDGPIQFGEFSGKMFITLPAGSFTKLKAAAAA